MKISELVEFLEDTRAEYGDVEVKWDSLSHGERLRIQPKIEFIDKRTSKVVVVVN